VSLRAEDANVRALHLMHAGVGPLRLSAVRNGGDALAASFRMLRVRSSDRCSQRLRFARGSIRFRHSTLVSTSGGHR